MPHTRRRLTLLMRIVVCTSLSFPDCWLISPYSQAGAPLFAGTLYQEEDRRFGQFHIQLTEIPSFAGILRAECGQNTVIFTGLCG